MQIADTARTLQATTAPANAITYRNEQSINASDGARMNKSIRDNSARVKMNWWRQMRVGIQMPLVTVIVIRRQCPPSPKISLLYE